ncbi:MAG: pilus assembly protein CpaC, partial [Rhodobacteraceae bacterium HLUCCA24]
MTIERAFRAALVGMAICVAQPPATAWASDVRVVTSGASSNLSVPMNRAIVVESEVPFAELSIANPQIADISSLSDRTIYVLGRAPGTTTLTLLDANGQLITNVEVKVAADVTEFKERLRQILPGEDIEVRTANDGIVLSGSVSSTQKMERALELAQRYAPERVSNLMSVAGVQQVMLKVRFAEMQRSVSKSLGTSLALGGAALSGDLGVQAGTNSGAAGTGQTSLLGGNLPSGTENNGALLLGFDVGAVEVGVLLEALESKGMVRTLAEPNLTALSGQEAKFLAGGEYPVPVAQEGGSVTVEFKPFGIELNFIPRVVDGDLINLELEAAVSSVDPSNGFQLDAFRIDA